MPRIAVVTSSPLFVEGGHLVMARALVRALREAGHESELVLTPQNRFGRQASAYLATWLTDAGMGHNGQRVDQVISLRYPSFAIRHPVHVCWLNHTMREYYDLWDQFSSRLSPQGRLKERIRRTLIRRADTYCFKHHVKKLFTQSKAVSERLARWNNVEGEPLHPPPPQRPYRCDGYGDYLFFASRLTPLKRADLVVRALARPEARGTHCVIGGDGEDRPNLERLAGDLGLADRVSFTGRLSESALVDHLARCRAVVFPPQNEDYGFVTVEAFAARKAVITCADSGGPLDLVRAGENGWIVEPQPAAMATAMAEATDDRGKAERLGAQGHQDIRELSWPNVVRKLVIV